MGRLSDHTIEVEPPAFAAIPGSSLEWCLWRGMLWLRGPCGETHAMSFAEAGAVHNWLRALAPSLRACAAPRGYEVVLTTDDEGLSRRIFDECERSLADSSVLVSWHAGEVV